VRPVPDGQKHRDNHDHVVHERGDKRRAETFLLLFEQKRHVSRMRALDVHRQVSRG